MGSADGERRSAAHPADGVIAPHRLVAVPPDVPAFWIRPVLEPVSAVWRLPARRQRFLSGERVQLSFEGHGLLACDAVSLGCWLPTFQ